MAWEERAYPVEIRRDVEATRLAVTDASELEAADERGRLAGNAMFQYIGRCTWEAVAAAVAGEARLIARLGAAADIDAEAERIDEERYDAFDDAESLWNLDVGVIGAVPARGPARTSPSMLNRS